MSILRAESFSNTSASASTGLARSAVGFLAGEQVMPRSAESVLENAREEISMLFGQKAEAKNFSERSVGGAGRSLFLPQAAIDGYLEAMERRPTPEEIARLLRSNTPGKDAADLASSPAMRFAFLRAALTKARTDEMAMAVIQRLEYALDDLEFANGREIRAALNTTAAARAYSGTPQGVENFHAAYADIALGHKSLAQSLLVILTRLTEGGADIRKGMLALLSALGADLASAQPSTDSPHLRAVIQEIYHLEVAQTALEAAADVSDLVHRQFAVRPFSPVDLMKALVALTGERWVAQNKVRELPTQFGVLALAACIAFYSGSASVLRKLPAHVFHDMQARAALLADFQRELDELAMQEEEQDEA